MMVLVVLAMKMKMLMLIVVLMIMIYGRYHVDDKDDGCGVYNNRMLLMMIETMVKKF